MVDQHPDPKENAMSSPQSTPLEPFIHIREEVPRYWMVDSLWTVLASAEATGGALTVLDQLMPHRSGPPTHIHDRLHEYFYLLDGEIQFELGQEVTTARTGAMLSIPAGTVHGFAVASKQPAYSTSTLPAASPNKSASSARPPVSFGSRTLTNNHPPPQSSTTPISPARPSSTPNAGYAPAKEPIFSPISVTNFGPNSIQVLDSEPACHHQV